MPVQVLGIPSPAADLLAPPSSVLEGTPRVGTQSLPPAGVRILVDIRMSNGVHLSQKNLSYQGLKDLVGKLEGLC